MSNKRIVLMGRDTDASPQTLFPKSFAEMGVYERKDLEEWVKKHPDILGSKLLLITSEFDCFDKSDKRLDLLAIDTNGKLVVIELKRDAAGSHADLQAIRYAAFCSAMTLADIAGLYAKFRGCHENEATETIRGFVEDPDFSELDNKPRIILAAGGFDDSEITSCVIWLRTFGLDISCVEITPYRMPDDGIVLVPRVIIPLPEAKDYIVRAETKLISQERKKHMLESALTAAATKGGAGHLVSICRQMKDVWEEYFSASYGGSYLYPQIMDGTFRSLFGVNVSGKRKNTPHGQLDVWVRIDNLVEVTKQDKNEIRDALAEYAPNWPESKDFVLRLATADQAQSLVDRLRAWAAAEPQAEGDGSS